MLDINQFAQHGITLANLAKQLPYEMAIKDHQSRYVWLNDRLAKLVGYTHPEDFIGATDFDLRCPAHKNAEYIQAQDKIYRHQKKPIQIYVVDQYSNGTKILKASVTPFISDINQETYLFLMLSEYKSHVIEKFLQEQQRHYLPQGQTTIHASMNFHHLNLSPRQLEIIFYLLRGYNSKKIGQILHTSSRTVDWHVENIKTILNCHSRVELIDIAMQHNLHNMIPESLLKPGTILDVSYD